MSRSYNLLLQPCGIFRGALRFSLPFLPSPTRHSCGMISDNVHGGPYYTQQGFYEGLLRIRSRRDIPLSIGAAAAWECTVFAAKSRTANIVACFTAITIVRGSEMYECRSGESQLNKYVRAEKMQYPDLKRGQFAMFREWEHNDATGRCSDGATRSTHSFRRCENLTIKEFQEFRGDPTLPDLIIEKHQNLNGWTWMNYTFSCATK